MSRTRKVLTTAALGAIAAPAAVSVWSGWVGLGAMAGFGPVDMLPGIGDGFVINTAITLPIGVEAYSAMALGVWLGHLGDLQTQRFARISALAALLIGMAGQVIYHVLIATGTSQAPIGVVIGVACLPVAVLGSAGALVHMLNAPTGEPQTAASTQTNRAGEFAVIANTDAASAPRSAVPEPATAARPHATATKFETPGTVRAGGPGVADDSRGTDGTEATVTIPGPFVTNRTVRDVIDVIAPAR